MMSFVYNRLSTVALFVIALCMLFFVFDLYVRPWIAIVSYSDKYKELALSCDIAMHEEAALRQNVYDLEQMESLRLSAEVGMMICHDYDKLRKKMLIQGVSDDRLAMIALEVLEHEQITVQQMVDAHRMDRF